MNRAAFSVPSSGEPERVALALKDEIRRSKISQRQVERDLGMGKGYLSSILNGHQDLKLKHLYQVLEAIRLKPRDSSPASTARNTPTSRWTTAVTATRRPYTPLNRRPTPATCPQAPSETAG